MKKMISHKDRVDKLINHFWKDGYLTVSRKHGQYLPSPNPIGKYDVDAIGKYKKKYVIGLILNKEDLDNPKTLNKIKYLSSRNTKYSSSKVKLFLGVPGNLLEKVRDLLLQLPSENVENIKIVTLPE